MDWTYSANFVKIAINVVRKPDRTRRTSSRGSYAAGSVPTPARLAHGTQLRLN